MARSILKISINNELDVVLAYKRTMQLSERLGMATANQTKFATAVSEICRNVIEHVGSGAIHFNIDEQTVGNFLEAQVTDRGRGIGNLEAVLNKHNYSRSGKGVGIVNSRKLVDQFEIESSFEKGTRVSLRKRLPNLGLGISKQMLESWSAEFEQEPDVSPYAEIKRQNMQLLEVLEQLRMRNLEAEQQLQEIRRLNAQLQQSNQEVNQLLSERNEKNKLLQEVNENLDAFAHTVSHDLRAPLQNINGITSALESSIEDGQREHTQHELHLLRQQTHKMDRLITGILAYSLAGQHNIQKKAVNTQQLLEQVISLLNIPATFILNISQQLPVLYTQEVYLYQVFSNLIGNAIKYHDQPEKGAITVGYEAKTEALYFTVEDNGPGIPQEQQDQIFNMYQSGNSFSRTDSTGLGLSIVRKIVDEKGGQICVTSHGRGSRFTFTWPLHELVQEA